MNAVTVNALVSFSKERRSALDEWSNKLERHEEFAVRGSTNIYRHNVEASEIVLRCLRHFPEHKVKTMQTQRDGRDD